MGRPPKHASRAEAASAKAASDHQRYLKKKDLKDQPRYIAYMPTPPDVPPITPAHSNLRSDVIAPVGHPALSPQPQPLPLPLPLPLALQPPIFYTQREDDDVIEEQNQQNQHEQEHIDNTINEYEESIQAHLDSVDLAACSKQLSQEAAAQISSSGSGKLATQKERMSLHTKPPNAALDNDDNYYYDDDSHDSDDDCPFTASSPLPLRVQPPNPPILSLDAALDNDNNNNDDPFAASSPLPLPLDEDEVDEENGPESVILHLAHQLHSFQGCSSEAHKEQRKAHTVYHKEEDIHPYCYSLPEITEIITSTFLLNSELLPNVLRSPKIIGQVLLPRVDFKAIFEG
jgi:hypothetical protein